MKIIFNTNIHKSTEHIKKYASPPTLEIAVIIKDDDDNDNNDNKNVNYGDIIIHGIYLCCT